MSHEATHVATTPRARACRCGCSRASPTTSRCATCDLPLDVTRRPDHRAGPPRRRARALPGAARVRHPDAHLGAAYESAWLACRLLAEHGGGAAAGRRSTGGVDGGDVRSTRRSGRRYGFGERRADPPLAGRAVRTWPRERPRRPAPRRARLVARRRRRSRSWLLAALAGALAPVPGGMPAPVPARRRLHRRRRSPGPRTTPATARLVGWASLAVSLAGRLCCSASPRRRAPARPAAGCRGGGRGRARGPRCWLIGRLVTLPFARGSAAAPPLDYGLSTQALAGLGRRPGSRRSAGGRGAPRWSLLVLVGCARRWPRAWPAIAAGSRRRSCVLGSFVYPVLVEPLFNRFTRCRTGRCGPRSCELADGRACRSTTCWWPTRPAVRRRSTPTSPASAAPGGWWSTTTWSTTCREDQALSVVAHELAHAKHDDVLVGTALGAVGAVARGRAAGAGRWAAGGVRRRAGVAGMADPRGGGRWCWP